MAAMDAPNPYPLPQSVGEVLGTSQLPDKIVDALSDQFQVAQ